MIIDNPPLNIITADVRKDLHRALDELESRGADVRALVVTGQGDRAFSVGADLAEEVNLTPDTARQFLEEDNGVYDRIEAMPFPSIAAINGYCMGGGFELALACDLRIAAEDAKLRAAGVRVGLVVSTTRLVRLVGLGTAADIILTGRTLTGTEAREYAVVTRTTPAGDLLPAAQALAATIASRAPLAVRRAKVSMREAMELNFADAYSRELDHFVALTGTSDHKHAIDAFFRGETPQFRGE
ncbi:MAG: enoyl-CoA hydratase/isomerase family protein [Betaproteobacteria bacterium]